MLDQAKIAAQNTLWNPSATSPEKQIGKITYTFDKALNKAKEKEDKKNAKEGTEDDDIQDVINEKDKKGKKGKKKKP